MFLLYFSRRVLSSDVRVKSALTWGAITDIMKKTRTVPFEERTHDMKKAAALILSAIMIFSLASCSFIRINRKGDEGDDTGTEFVTEPVTEPDTVIRVPDGVDEAKREAQARVAALPDHEFSKDTFSVAVTPGIVFAPEHTADRYDDALNERCGIAGGRYGITFSQIETPLELMLSDSYSAYLSGSYYSDAMMIPQSALGEFTEKGHLLNIQSIPHFDVSADYFDRDAMAQAAAGYTNPAVIGSVTKDVSKYYCVYVNTSLIGDGEFDDIRTCVEDGSWTWQKLLEVKRAVSDINGGVGGLGASDLHGFTDTVYFSGGQNYFSCGFGKVPSVAFDTDLTVTAVEILKSLYNDGVTFDSFSETGTALGDFIEGKLLFHIDTVSEMTAITEMGIDWCLLPIPKTDPEQTTYAARCSPDAPVMVIPSSGTDPDDVGAAVTALGAASYGYLDRCYYDRLITTSLNRSSTLDMFDYVCGIKGGRGVYDFTDMYASRFQIFDEDTSGALWELVTGGGTLGEKAAASRFDLNWRLANAFPVVSE